MGPLDLAKRRRVPHSAHKRLEFFLLRDGDVLFNSTNSPDGVGRAGLIRGLDEPAVFSNHFFRLRTDFARLDPGFLTRWLNWNFQRGVFLGMCRQWVNQATVARESLLDMPIDLPRIEEQRRIAAILDHADSVRTRRRHSLAQLASLTSARVEAALRSGKPDYVKLGELTTSMRNGLSPSSKGEVAGRVLTLSAVTRGSFDPFAAKDALFECAAHASQRVCADTLLICRGNGNRDLVGVGEMANQDFPDLIYPDTVIAATPDATKVVPRYLWAVWRLPQVRATVQSSAKTTNGIHKVNQGGLSSISLPILPHEQQRGLVANLDAVGSVGDQLRRSEQYLDQLFEVLQARAFSGKL